MSYEPSSFSNNTGMVNIRTSTAANNYLKVSLKVFDKLSIIFNVKILLNERWKEIS
jgi:hypothetical protein